MILYEYKCPNHGIFEGWATVVTRDVPQKCNICNTASERVASTPSVKLPGWCDTFPSASMKWENRHIKEGSKNNP